MRKGFSDLLLLVKLADALATTVDYLLTGNPVEDTKLASTRLFRRFQALETLAEGDHEAIIKVIDAMVCHYAARVGFCSAPAPLRASCGARTQEVSYCRYRKRALH